MKPKTTTTSRKKGKGTSKQRARAVAAPRLASRPGKRSTTPRRAALRVIPAAPVAAFGLGELLIRAWAARQCAA